jgi:hypothetical protein
MHSTYAVIASLNLGNPYMVAVVICIPLVVIASLNLGNPHMVAMVICIPLVVIASLNFHMVAMVMSYYCIISFSNYATSQLVISSF